MDVQELLTLGAVAAAALGLFSIWWKGRGVDPDDERPCRDCPVPGCHDCPTGDGDFEV